MRTMYAIVRLTPIGTPWGFIAVSLFIPLPPLLILFLSAVHPKDNQTQDTCYYEHEY